MENITLFARGIGLNKSDLMDALTHFSFYEDKNENKGNSRYVFAGMFIFRGELAKVLAKYLPGSGTQLQHTLGNMVKNEYLHQLFDEWGLISLVRAGTNFDVKLHKHIFVYGVLGCAALHENEKIVQKIISRWFLKKATMQLHGRTSKNRNYRGQADFLAKSIFKSHVILQLSQNEGMHHATVIIKNGAVLSEASSKSYRYARNKALKQAVALMAEMNAKDFVQQSDYIERVKNRILAEKGKKKKLLTEKHEDQEKRRLELKERSIRLKAQRDALRRKAKAEAKVRRDARKALIAEKKKESSPLNAKKRRYLEDKKK